MTTVNSKVSAPNDSAPAGERAAAPILITGQDLEAVAAAARKGGGAAGEFCR